MKRRDARRLLFVWCMHTFWACTALLAQNATLAVQGVLKNADGTTVPDGGNYSLTFKLWDAETGGNTVWMETKTNVSIIGGLYDVVLGDGAVVLSAPFDRPYFLGVSIGNGSGEEFIPRPRLTSAPYALSLLGTSNIFPSAGSVGVNTLNPHSSAILEMQSTTRGLLTPRMNQASRDAIASPATGLLIYQTDNTPGFYYYTGSAWKSVNEFSASAPLQIGDTHLGGIIFYLEPSGVNGLVVASVTTGYDAVNFSWGCTGTAIPAARGTAVGSGEANTYSIIENCSVAPAADRAEDPVQNNYSDWFLPSRDELLLMHRNLHLAGLGGFGADAYYWSSTENDANTAYSLQFTSDPAVMPQAVNKSTIGRVRMIRKF